MAGVAIPHVNAAGNSTLQVELVGCGGRGGGAAGNALSANKSGPITLAAMADVFEQRLSDTYSNLKKQFNDLVDVAPDKRFIGFDGYQKAMDVLKPGDIVILTTPLAFRWVHFTYAIQKGLNVFMEKPLSSDGVTSKKMLALAEQATAKNLKVGVGLMSRHAKPLMELLNRITDIEISDVLLI